LSTRKQRLELTWIGKDERPRLEPRILLEDADQSYHAKMRRSDSDRFDNLLIHGDNLLALKALEQEFSGLVKCIYIDPPFNTQQAMPNYDDGVEHSLWLTLMRNRLELLHQLLAAEGTLFVHIDDNELGYLIALLDSIFGRSNRLYVITFKQGSATGHKSINPGCVSTTNFLLMYAKDKNAWKPNRVFTGRERDNRYGQFIVNVDEHFEKWRFVTLLKAFSAASGLTEKDARKLVKDNPEKLDAFVLQNAANVIRSARPDYESVSEAARQTIDASKQNPSKVFKLPREDHADMYFIGGERILFYADKLKLVDGELVAGEPLTTLWDDILSNNLHNEGGIEFPKGKKPEALIKRVLDLTTDPGDLVLDSFAGSGTTGAVAHKMSRRWIMLELGDHAITHIVPRMRAVVDGTDVSGVSKAIGWKGGGGFRYYRLAPSLLEKDAWGNWVIAQSYDAAKLAQAVCKLMGFNYQPDEKNYWMQGRSSETDFIYVTTQNLTHQQLLAISEEVGDTRTLLVCCKAFRADADEFPNLTIRKIPQAVLRKCEWGKDDYSLNIASLPEAVDDQLVTKPLTSAKTKSSTSKGAQDDLFSRGSSK